MWILYAAGSAFFAGVTSILAKCGIRKTDSTVATAVRTVVVLIFAWLIVWIVGSADQISSIDGKTLLFLILSGAATGASWLCYFRALQLGISIRWFHRQIQHSADHCAGHDFPAGGDQYSEAAAVLAIAAGIF